MRSVGSFLKTYVITAPRRWYCITLCSNFILLAAIGALAAHNYFEPVNHASEAFTGHPLINNMLLVAHIILSICAMAIGPWMFNEKLRNDYRGVHRKMGQIYVIGCMLGAVSAFPLALANAMGPIPQFGFGTLAVMWFSITYLAYTSAIHKDFVAHRRWMMRSFALTFAFFIVQMYKIFLFPFFIIVFDIELAHMTIKVMQSYCSWLGNWMIVETYLAATTFKGRFVGWKQFLKNVTSIAEVDMNFRLSPIPPRRVQV